MQLVQANFVGSVAKKINPIRLGVGPGVEATSNSNYDPMTSIFTTGTRGGTLVCEMIVTNGAFLSHLYL